MKYEAPTSVENAAALLGSEPDEWGMTLPVLSLRSECQCSRMTLSLAPESTGTERPNFLTV
jgi:hypothetical protein